MKRKLFEKLLRHCSKREFTILTGARQTGKSTLLKDLDKTLKNKGEPTVFLNLENKILLEELNNSPLNLLAYLPTVEKKVTFFIDEIQYLNDPSNFLKLLYDDHSYQVKIVCSGSSAFFMDNKFKDSLAGRKRIFRINTCDFEEFLMLKNKKELLTEIIRIQENKNYKSVKTDLLRLEWEEYMLYGGYPAVVIEPDSNEKKEILKEIRDSFVKRDIQEAGVRNEDTFYQLLKILASQTGQLVNVNELANTLRTRNETIQSYLEVMQTCFHLTLVKPFFANLRKELTKMPKGYLMDTGLRNCLINNFQPINMRLDKGELWEMTVFRMLVDKHGEDAIHFWRTADGKEVDFIIPDLQSPLALESKFDRNQIKAKKYNYFQENYPNFNFEFATLSPWSEDFFRMEHG
ncbi:ATP-binding protein [Belliella baltica]|nr:ATP-binding protein [Belliella baltica]